MDKSAAGGGSQPSAPPAVASQHPRWRSTKAGRYSPTPPAALHKSLRSPLPEHRPQLVHSSPDSDPRERERRRESGRRHPATLRLRRGGEAAGPPATQGWPKCSLRPSVTSPAPGLPAGGSRSAADWTQSGGRQATVSSSQPPTKTQGAQRGAARRSRTHAQVCNAQSTHLWGAQRSIATQPLHVPICVRTGGSAAGHLHM